jgi:hypothetical protein
LVPLAVILGTGKNQRLLDDNRVDHRKVDEEVHGETGDAEKRDEPRRLGR